MVLFLKQGSKGFGGVCCKRFAGTRLHRVIGYVVRAIPRVVLAQYRKRQHRHWGTNLSGTIRNETPSSAKPLKS